MTELETIVTLIKDIGGEAKTAFVVYVLADKLGELLCIIAGCVGVSMSIRCVIRAVNTSPTETLARWRNRLGIGSAGPLTDSERIYVEKAIDKLIEDDISRRASKQKP